VSDLIPPWKFERPLCAEIGTEIFYIEDKDEITDKVRQADYQSAKLICSKCEHITECGEWAVKKEVHGFWGGFTPRERRDIRGRLNIVLEEEGRLVS
jgi:hypothetical protein